jgi:hypothetical protein
MTVDDVKKIAFEIAIAAKASQVTIIIGDEDTGFRITVNGANADAALAKARGTQ